MKYYDLVQYPIHHSYYGDEKYNYELTFNRYVGIRLVTSFEKLCDSDKSCLLDEESKIIKYTYIPWLKTKQISTTYDCEKLFINDIPPDIIYIPNDTCIKYSNGTIDCDSNCEKKFISETKIQEYEQKYQEMYDNIVLNYSQHIEQLKKHTNNIYRFIMVVDDNGNHTNLELEPEFELDEKIEYMFKLMIKNDYMSVEVEIDSVVKNSSEFDGVDFIGKINSYNRKIENNSINKGFRLNDTIVLKSSVYTYLLKGSPDDVNISQSSFYFLDTNFTIILIREDIYKKRFLEWIYEYLN